MNDDAMNNEAINDDALLTAFLDGELEDAEAATLRARLNAESPLRGRLELLRASQLPFRASFDALSAGAPLERMLARLSAHQQPRSGRAGLRAAALAASAAAIFLIGALVGHFALKPNSETWRSAVAGYMDLYAGAAFPTLPPDEIASTLVTLSNEIGQKLEANALTIDGLAPAYVAALSYDQAPLAEIGYQDGEAAIALCIIKNGEADAPPRSWQSGRLAEVAWAQGGRGYLAIGAAPPARIEAFARAARAKLPPSSPASAL